MLRKFFKKCEVCDNIRNHVQPRRAAPGITVPKEVTSSDTIFMDHKEVLNTFRKGVIAGKKKRTPNDEDWVPSEDKQSCLSTRCFTSLKTWLKSTFNTELHHTSGYHPSSNLSERMHREFERVLKTYNTDSNNFGYENWADNLAKACISMNSMKHSIISIYYTKCRRTKSCEIEFRQALNHQNSI